MGKALERWRQEVIEDLGGRAKISAQQEAILALAVKNKLVLDSIDRCWIFSQPSLVERRKRVLLPVVRERQSIADGFAKYMSMLGLERRHKVKRLNEVLNEPDGHEQIGVNGNRKAN